MWMLVYRGWSKYNIRIRTYLFSMGILSSAAFCVCFSVWMDIDI